MKPEMSVFQTALVDVRIDLSRGDIGVAEHFLDDTEIAAVVEQVGGETVAQRVRFDVLGDAGGLRMALDPMPDGLGAHLLAVRGKKYFRAVAIVLSQKRA